MLEKHTYKTGEESVWFWCSPCDTHHRFVTKRADGAPPQSPQWGWNGDLDKPTFTPSLFCNRDATPEDIALGAHRCHLFLREGMVQYLNDCSHSAAGTTVPVEPPRI